MAKKKDSTDIQVIVLFEKDMLRVLRYPEDEEDRDELFFELFSERDDQGYYDDTEHMSEKHLALLDKANKGDKESARIFLNLRCGHNYKDETFQIFTVE
jgi:hypothetical protein